MKKLTLLVLLAEVLAVGCAPRTARDPMEVVDESYVHRYGVEVDRNDWSARGESGKVVTTLRNGVVVSKSYANGVLEGETSYTYPHSELIEITETYSRGALVKEVRFYRNGTISQQTDFQSPTQRKVFTWFENGTPASTETFLNELLVKGEYYNINHQLDSRIDNSSGLRTRRDPFGHMEGADTIVGGIMTSTKTFHPNGAVKQLTPYTNNMIDGLVRNYLPDGQPSSIETWVQGDKTGITTIFENGEKVADVPYVRGVKDGIEKHYRNGNTVVEEISWVQDSRHGPVTSFVGDVATTDYFYHDKPVSRAVFEKMTNGVIPNAQR